MFKLPYDLQKDFTQVFTDLANAIIRQAKVTKDKCEGIDYEDALSSADPDHIYGTVFMGEGGIGSAANCITTADNTPLTID